MIAVGFNPFEDSIVRLVLLKYGATHVEFGTSNVDGLYQHLQEVGFPVEAALGGYLPLAHFPEIRKHQAMTVGCDVPGRIGPSVLKPPGDGIDQQPSQQRRHQSFSKHAALNDVLPVWIEGQLLCSFEEYAGEIRAHRCSKPGTPFPAKERAVEALIGGKMVEESYQWLWGALHLRPMIKERNP